MKHYKYGGSTAARQLACPGWQDLKVKLGMPEESGSSEYAREGTALHKCMEMLLSKVDDPLELVGQTVEGVEITAGHLELLDDALDTFLDFEEDVFPNDEKTTCLIEEEVTISDEIGGTADLLMYDDKTVSVLDWKFGQGVEVSAEKSAQAMFYLMCAEHKHPELFEGKQKLAAIVQPMPSRGTDTLKLWEVPDAEYKAFKQGYFASLKSNKLSAGRHCQFCPNAPLCPVKTGEAKSALLLDPKGAKELDENIALAYSVKAWADDVLKFAHEQMEEGLALPNWKLVQKRAMRKWGDSDAVFEILNKMRSVKREEYTAKPVLLSPAQIEKAFKRKKLDFEKLSDYIESKSSGTTLAPATDEREAALSTKGLTDALSRIE